MFCRNLRRFESVEEGDRSSVQTDLEEPRDQRGTHHNWRLHGTAVHRAYSSSSSSTTVDSEQFSSSNGNAVLQGISPTTVCQSPKFLVTSICNLPDVINCQFRKFTVATLGPMNFLSLDQWVWNSPPDHLRDPAVDSEQFRWDLNNDSNTSK